MELQANYNIILSNNKKYIFCNRDCEHLIENTDIYAHCEYFEKELKGDQYEYKPCKECFTVFSQTRFDIN